MAVGFNPPGQAAPAEPCSRGVWVPEGARLKIAGTVAFDAQGQVVGKGDMAAQTRQVMANIKAVLDCAGGTLDDIVSMVVYVTSLDDCAAIHAVRREFLKPPYPTSTLVQVNALVHPDLMIEIECEASIPTWRARRPKH